MLSNPFGRTVIGSVVKSMRCFSRTPSIKFTHTTTQAQEAPKDNTPKQAVKKLTNR